MQLVDGFYIPDGDLPKHHIAESVVQHDAILNQKVLEYTSTTRHMIDVGGNVGRWSVDFAKYFEIPCVGGKVSLFNETSVGPIKPTPVIGVLGLIEKNLHISQRISKDDCLVIVGDTKDELGGSEFFEYVQKLRKLKN